MSDLDFLTDPDRACADLPVEVFFPAQPGDGAAALRVCRRCPVQQDCLQYALDHPQHGIWGGTTAKDRRAMARAAGRSYWLVRSHPLAGPPPTPEAVRRRELRSTG